MEKLYNIGRIFYGISIAALGLLTIYYHDFPYMLIPPKHLWVTNHAFVIYIAGALLFLAGVCIVPYKRSMPVSFILGVGLLLIFCFDFIPYQLSTSSRYMHFGAWENAAKELALAGGAFVVAKRRWGVILFALTIISFSIDHFLYAKEAAGYVPSWIANPVFWLYVTGLALLGSGIAILFKIKPALAAVCLGTMIFIWVIILHIPKMLAAPIAVNGGEIISGFLALAYCGTAFCIAGSFRNIR